ncbi:MAG: hypothetical protein LBN94_03265 [Puniceicoccales bacterium]|nr:hypothetical protein [Puniceicoccales bacterium]
MKYSPRPIFFLAFLFLCGGCKKTTPRETDHPSYKNGQQLLAENLPERALSQFLRVIGAIPNAKKAYLEIGQIYLNTYDDPVLAIYYFRQFLLHDSRRENEKIVQSLIETAKKRFLQQIIGQNKELYNEHQNFLSLLKHLREENLQLKTELEWFKTRGQK